LCFVGNFDINVLPPETYLKTKEFTDILLHRLNIPRDAIYGHYIFDWKSCPGRRLDTLFFKR
jgi:hypothetical protein